MSMMVFKKLGQKFVDKSNNVVSSKNMYDMADTCQDSDHYGFAQKGSGYRWVTSVTFGTEDKPKHV